jgi:hypothetical protein
VLSGDSPISRPHEIVHACAVGLFVLTLAAFLPALWAGWVNYDDEMNFLRNPHFAEGRGGLTWENLTWMWTSLDGVYIPLTWMSLELDCDLWGLKPGGYHATSLLLHATNAVLLLFLLRSLLRAGSADPDAPVTLFAAVSGAALWALHPLRTESVAWITERRDVLCGLFFMLTMLAYLRMARETPENRGRWLAIAVALYACSMLSKASAMALPVVLVILDVVPLRRLSRETLIEKIPFFVIAIALAVVAAFAQRHAGAAATLERHGILERNLQANYGLIFYVWKTVLPTGLSPLYLLSKPLSIGEPRFIAAILAVPLVTAASFVWRRRRPEVLATWISYAVLVSPVLGFAQSGPHLVADRFTYLPCLTWSALAAAGLLSAARYGRLVYVACGGLAAILVALSIRQATFWHDSFAMWNRVLVVEPDNFTARQGLGSAHLERREWREAIAEFTRAIELHRGLPDAYTSRGFAYMNFREHDAALADFDRALALEPKLPLVHHYRGLVFAERGDPEAAARAHQKSLDVAPPEWPLRARVEAALLESRRKMGNPR